MRVIPLVMRTSRIRSSFACLVVLFFSLSAAISSPVSVPKQPSIAAIRPGAHGRLTVLVRVPKGIRRVTLQVLDGKTWVTRAIAHVDGAGANTSFQVPRGTSKRSLQVTGTATDVLPTGFFKGKAHFASSSASTSAAGVLATSSPGLTSLSSGGIVAGNGAVASASNSSNASVSTPVTEADIWEISGSTLYFFNQYRGLQVIDIANPDAPKMLGELSLPAVGEDMYVIDSNHVILLARSGSQWSRSEVIAVTLDNNQPSIAARLPINGSIDTSRLVGSALYVASEGWQSGSYVNGDAYGTRLSSFDLSNPAAPVARGTLWNSGYSNVTTVAGNFLFAATNSSDWRHSDVRVVDISATDGTMVVSGTLRAAGVVSDKFKLGVNGSVLTVISEIWPEWTQQGWQTGSTKLETFSLSVPAAPVKLGEVGFGDGDWLYGTCLTGNFAYVVTAVQIDPLWIVDLSDPAAPTITGKLEVPGRSTYLKSLGTQLLTIGIVNQQVAVSLFDVKDPTAPALLSQLSLGGTYSWSEANFDEKAFSVLSSAGLALVPVNSYDPQSGEASQVQLIDIGANSLTKRGVINAHFGPRRATEIDQRILAISGRELLTVDDSDRDQPSVTSDVSLAWPVNQVFVQGDYLLEVETGGGWWSQSTPMVRVTPASEPDTVAGETELSGDPICGAAVREGKLYVAQATQGGYIVQSGSTAKTSLSVSIFDLSQLPQLVLTGTTVAQVDSLGWNSSLKALWPNPQTLVWATNAQNRGPIFWGGALRPIAMPNLVSVLAAASPSSKSLSVAAAPAVTSAGVSSAGSLHLNSSAAAISPGLASTGLISNCIFWGWSADSYLLAFDVGSAASPVFLGQTKVAPGAWNQGPSFVGGNLIFGSHSGSWQVPANTWLWANKLTNWISAGWVQGWSLDVIDFTNPATPVVRDPVSIPSQLVGISNATADGAVLYTEGAHSQNTAIYQQFLDASAYDGVSASLIDSVTLPDWSAPVVVSGSTVFIGHSTTDSTGTLDSWSLGSTGKFIQLGTASLAQAPTQLCPVGNLLVAQAGTLTQLFDVSSPARLTLLDTADALYNLSLDLSDGDPLRGVWIPLGDYGVQFLDAAP